MHTFPEPRDAETAPTLTPRQRKVLEVIREHVERLGYPPSVREIGDAAGLTSTSSVAHQMRTLEKKGFLRRNPNRPRALDVRLPEEGAAAAVTRLARLDREAGLLGKDVLIVDLRMPDRIVVRLTEEAAAARQAVSSTHSPTGTIEPVSSARSRKSAGVSRPLSGWFQRTSASQPRGTPVARSTMG